MEIFRFLERNDGVADDLAWAVVSDVAATICFCDGNAFLDQLRLIPE